jgi:sugar phosphate isomerase/epimerase
MQYAAFINLFISMKKRSIGAAAVLVAGLAVTATQAQIAIPAECLSGGFAIGAQAYSFNRFTVFEAIEKTAEAGGRVIEFYPGQKVSADNPASWDHNASDELIAKVQAKLKQHHVKAVNYGVVGIPNDEAGARKIFEFAKKLGLYAVTTESTESIDLLDKLVKEYDVCVDYHNHPRNPGDANYKVWDPNYILQLVSKHDKRIGACADTGHWTRSGLKPVDCLKILKGRIISSHLKDLNEFGKGDAHDVPYGTGVSNIPGVLDELRQQGFKGNISVEYEYNWDHSVPEIAQCIGYVRGYGQAKQ